MIKLPEIGYVLSETRTMNFKQFTNRIMRDSASNRSRGISSILHLYCTLKIIVLSAYDKPSLEQTMPMFEAPYFFPST